MYMMSMDFFRSLVWFLLILFVGLGATFIVASEIRRTQLKPSRPILARDTIGAGSHTLSGIVMVPSSCDEIIVNTRKTSDTSYALIVSTWREPYIPTCISREISREFRAIIFAPSIGVSFTASLDGVPVPIAVIPEIPLRHTSTTSAKCIIWNTSS